jgi:hypothetical protein
MSDRLKSTLYLPGEGRAHLRACMTQTFKACAQAGIERIVIFTATGEGPLYAVRRFLPRPTYRNLRLLAVTLPEGKAYPIDPRHPERGLTTPGVAPPIRTFLVDSGVPVITPDRLPFSADGAEDEARTKMVTLTRAFDVLGGGVSFCIQAVLVACDQGAVQIGERVAVMTSDTSLIVVASNSEHFLSPEDGLLIQQIICRPAVYNISKARHRSTRQALSSQAEQATQLSLTDDEDDD